MRDERWVNKYFEGFLLTHIHRCGSVMAASIFLIIDKALGRSRPIGLSIRWASNCRQLVERNKGMLMIRVSNADDVLCVP